MNLYGDNSFLGYVKTLIHDNYATINNLQDTEETIQQTINQIIQSYPNLGKSLRTLEVSDSARQVFISWARETLLALANEYIASSTSQRDITNIISQIILQKILENGVYFNQPAVTESQTSNSTILYVDHSIYQSQGGVDPLAQSDWNVILQTANGFRAERASPQLLHEANLVKNIESSLPNAQWTLTINEYPVLITESISYKTFIISDSSEVSKFTNIFECSINQTGQNEWTITQIDPRQQYIFTIAGDGTLVKTRNADDYIHWPGNFEVPANSPMNWLIDFNAGVYTCGGAVALRATTTDIDVTISVNHLNFNAIPNAIQLTQLNTSWRGFAFPVMITKPGTYILNILNGSDVPIAFGSFGIAPATPLLIYVNPNSTLTAPVVYSRTVQPSLMSWLALLGIYGIYKGTVLVE